MSMVPLSVLLSWAWIAHVMEIDNAVEAAGAERTEKLFKVSVPMWANALRLISEEGITAADLRGRAGASCNLGGLERWGWISVGDQPGRRPGYGTNRGLRAETVIRPTRAGRYASRLFPQMVDLVEQRWRDRFGTQIVDTLRDQLASAKRVLPWSPPEVHPSDGFITHVTGGELTSQDAPLVVLLGQCLTERTIEAERRGIVSLPLAATLLRVVEDNQIALRDLPELTGLSKEAIAMAVGYLERRHLAVTSPDRTVRLTRQGIEARRAYLDSTSREDDDSELYRALGELLQDTDALAAGLEPPKAAGAAAALTLPEPAGFWPTPPATCPGIQWSSTGADGPTAADPGGLTRRPGRHAVRGLA
jgi:hypothetical protein